MTVGENIRRLRKEQGLTQKQLGQLCGINEANIRKYELGGANPKIETLHKIAKALEKSIILLVEGCDDKYPLTPNDFRIDLANTMTDEEKWIQDYMNGNTPENSWKRELDLLNHFRKLNKKGEIKALEQVELLTKVPEYQKYFNSTATSLNAAHAVPETSKENKKHDEDIMNDDSQWS